jgi:hypothetical protein
VAQYAAATAAAVAVALAVLSICLRAGH